MGNGERWSVLPITDYRLQFQAGQDEAEEGEDV